MNKGNKKDFLPSIGFWPAKSGNGFTVFVSEDLKKELGKAIVGSTLLLKEVESDNDKAPAFRIVIMPPRDSDAASL